MLKKEMNYKSINLTWYYKVIWVDIIETWSDEEWKLYSAICSINLYPNQDKTDVLDSDIIEFKDIREDKFNLTDLYNAIKTLPEFENSIDC